MDNLDDDFRYLIEGEKSQNSQETAKTFIDMLFDAMGGENSPMLRKTEQWGDICRDQPEIPLTDHQRDSLRNWAYSMVVFSGVVDLMANVVERAVHLGYCHAKREYY